MHAHTQWYQRDPIAQAKTHDIWENEDRYSDRISCDDHYDENTNKNLLPKLFRKPRVAKLEKIDLTNIHDPDDSTSTLMMYEDDPNVSVNFYSKRESARTLITHKTLPSVISTMINLGLR